MNNTASINFLAYPSSFNNSGTISLFLSLTFPENIPSGRLRINVPNEINIGSSSCTQCTIIPPHILLDVAASTNSLSLTLAGLKNVGSFKKVSDFKVWHNTTAGHQSLEATASGWTNTVLTSFSVSVYGNNNYRNENNTFVFQVDSLS